MLRLALLVAAAAAVAEASVKVTRSSRDGRHPTAMELEVQLPHGGKSVRIPLKRTDEFEKVPITVRSQGVSRTFSSRQVHDPSHAHYRDIESRSVVSVREVNGRKRFAGHFQHKGMSYFVTPEGDGHLVTPNHLNPQDLLKEVQQRQVLSRRRRQVNTDSTTNIIEVALCIDSTVWTVFNSLNGSTALTELHYYFTHIMNGVDVAFRNIGDPAVSVRTVSLTVSTSAADDAWMPAAGVANRLDGSVILQKMAESYMPTLAAPRPDHVMAFTREDIHGGGNTAVCGMAYLSAACTSQGVSINEDQGLHSWGTAAHELAHNLGSQHDGSGNTCDAGAGNIMASSGGFYDISNVANSYRFSPCSVASMTGYITSDSAACLRTSMGTQVSELQKIRSEGMRLSLDQVCKLSYPNSPGKFFLSSKATSTPASICANIYCESAGGGGTSMAGMRAPVGTPCSSKKSCDQNGQCSDDDAAPEADNNCFWGDTLSSTNCAQWVNVVGYDAYKASYCPYVKSNCCRSVGTVCNGY